MLWAASLVVLAAASLAGGRSSIEHHDATLAKHDITSRRLSQTPDGCALYIAGPVVASTDNQVATVDSLQDYELTFTMELASDWSITGEWQSVLHIGDTNSRRAPGLWFHNYENALYARHAYIPCCNSWGPTTTGVTFTAGETYDIKMVVQNNQMTVYVDGVSVGTAAGSSTYVATGVAVHVGDPWYDAAKVTLSDITLSEIALADTCRENVASLTTGSFTVQEGRCYARDQMSSISSEHYRYCWGGCCVTETAQECYTCCDGDVGPSGVNAIGVEITYNPNAQWHDGQYKCYCWRLGDTDKRIQNYLSSRLDACGGLVGEKSFDSLAGTIEDTNPCKRPTGHSVAVEDIDWSSTNEIICFTETFDVDAMTTTACSDFDERFFFEAGRCYPASGAPGINTEASVVSGGLSDFDFETPQECYDYCAGVPTYYGLELDRFHPRGPMCLCEVAPEDYNAIGACKTPAGTSVAIADMDWSSITEKYICFTKDLNANTEISTICGEGDDDSDNNSLAVILGVVAAVVIIVGIGVFAIMKRRRSAKPPPAPAPAPPVHEPPPAPLAPIKAEALEMMTETAEVTEEATNLPPGHITGAEAAALMAEGEPPQQSEGWGARSLQRLASWRGGSAEAMAVEPPPPPAEAYVPEAELEPEC